MSSEVHILFILIQDL